jgi:hypothetical protein
LQTVGFSLSEIGVLMTGDKRGSWQEIVDRKMAELAEQEQRLKMARAALEHARQCRTGDPARCPRFWSIIGYSDLTGPNNRCHSWEGRARSPNMSTDRAEIGVTTG